MVYIISKKPDMVDFVDNQFSHLTTFFQVSFWNTWFETPVIFQVTNKPGALYIKIWFGGGGAKTRGVGRG